MSEIFNKIKNKLEIPDSWFELIVATIFRNKGTKKKTKYIGVFFWPVCVLYKVFEKVVKISHTRKNWTNEVKDIINEYEIRVDDITTISRNVWKNRVKFSVL